jgi:hypothetical protein
MGDELALLELIQVRAVSPQWSVHDITGLSTQLRHSVAPDVTSGSSHEPLPTRRLRHLER